MYGPLEPWINKTWRPGEVEPVEREKRFIQRVNPHLASGGSFEAKEEDDG